MVERACVEFEPAVAAINDILEKAEPIDRLRILGTVAAKVSRAGSTKVSNAQAKLDSVYQLAVSEVEAWFHEREPPRWKPITFMSGNFSDDVQLVSVTGPTPIAGDKLRLVVKEQEEGLGSIVWFMRFVDNQKTAEAVNFYAETGAALRECLRKEVFEPLGLPEVRPETRQIRGSKS